MKTAIIHLGTHKAASTSIQLFLSHNREALREAGICYPEAPPPTSFAHHGMAWTIIRRYTGLERRPANFSLEDALAQFADSEADTLFLSSEDFLTTSFYEGFLDEFFARLRQTFERIVVCAFVRSRKDFFNSSYNQWVKSLSFSQHFGHYLNQALSGVQAPMHYTKALSLWGELADERVFLPFLPKTFGAAPELYLLEKLGVQASVIESLEPFSSAALNASIGPRAVIAFRRLSHSLHESDWYEHYDLEKREMLLYELENWAADNGWNTDKFRAMTPQQAQRIADVFAAEDEQFSRRYFAAGWAELFPQDAKHDASTQLSYADLDEALRSEVDDFVRAGFRLAKDIYVKGRRPQEERAEAAAAENAVTPEAGAEAQP